MKEKSSAGISLLISKKHKGAHQVLCPHLKDKSLSTVHMPSQQMHCGGICDLTQVYFGAETSS